MPLAEIKTAGVIMAVRTPSDADSASMLYPSILTALHFEAKVGASGESPDGGPGGVRAVTFVIFSAQPMAENDYHFIDCWRVEGKVQEVADILEDALSLPQWWGSVYFAVKEVEPGGDGGIGRLISLHAGGWLPYTLHINFRTVESRYPHGFSMDATGDLEGHGVWTFAQDGGFVDITYDWTIRANKPVIERLSFLLKPIFRSNHNWTMNRGEESLKLELRRRRARSDAERASIPRAPGPSLVVRLLGLSA